MTWEVEPLMWVGSAAFGAIVATDVDAIMFGRVVAGHGKKRPEVIIVVRDGAVDGIDLSGQPLDALQIERRFPGALDKINAKVAAPIGT